MLLFTSKKHRHCCFPLSLTKFFSLNFTRTPPGDCFWTYLNRKFWLYAIIMSRTSFRLSFKVTATRLWTKWVWVWIPVLSLKLWIWRLLRTRSSLTIRQTIEYRFTLKLVCDMIATYSQMHRTEKYSWHSSIIWRGWLNGWVFVYKLSVCWFELHCCHIQMLPSRKKWG